MNSRTSKFSILAILLLSTAWPCSSALVAGVNYQSGLTYQDRGDRYEGIRGSPVSDRVELISALVDYKEDTDQIPERVKLKFYLSEQSNVFITVREIDNRHNYWMDRIRPPSGWHPGFGNEFQWPTQEVITSLRDFQLYELGVVARVGNDDPSPDVRVAPCILFHSRSPASIRGYLFAFRIGRKADVTCSFSRDENNSPALSTQSFAVPGHRPRTVSWNASNAREGWYRLRINVVYSNNGQEVNQIVHFYHRPYVR